ncbi:MAG TPA: nucleotidyltransferase domain-containing protein [Nitrospinaceae bacterium]|nr:nucleotidyltransferase domain-containing protein [Nitrospinaceae bacterium]
MYSMNKGFQDDIAEVGRIVLEGLRRYPVRVYLFGSSARGEVRKGSDIDVAVLPLNPLPDGTLSAIRETLEESRVLCQVDLVDLSTSDPAFSNRVFKEGVMWTESRSA